MFEKMVKTLRVLLPDYGVNLAIDGKAIANEIKREVRVATDRLAARGLRRPGLAVILVGEDPASAVYVRNKVAACEKAGMRSLRDVYAVDVDPAIVFARIAEDVGELQRLAEIDGVVAAGRVLVAEDFNAQEADDRRHSMAVEVQLLPGFVALRVEVHLAALDEFVEQLEAQSVGADERL